MKILTKLFISFLIVTMVFCDSVEPNENSNKNVFLTGVINQSDWANDPFIIDTAYIIENNLFVNIHYSGGCKEHIFKLVLSTAIAKSNPPQTAALLSHKGNNDFCEAWVGEELKFDLSSFRNYLVQTYNGVSSIIINVNYYNETIMYSF